MSSSVGLLLILLLIKMTITLFTIYLYAKISPFPDSELYLNSSTNWSFSFLFNRTFFTASLYGFLKHILVFNTAVHLFISLLLGCTFWFALKDEYEFFNKPLLCGCLFLPHFLIWSGIVGKEALAIAGFMLIVKVCVDLVIWHKIRILPLLVGLFIGLIERPHYAMAYIYLFFISLLITKSKIRFMSFFSTKVIILSLLVVIGYGCVLFYEIEPLLLPMLFNFMNRTQQYFLYSISSTGNRWDILWSHPSDFFYNLGWGLPVSIIGPTSSEALNRPLLLPVFLEGCTALILFLIICYLLFVLIKRTPQFSTLIIWGFVPAVLIGLLINYPFGIFNPGSAIRYKQSLAPLLYFYPLLLLAAIRKNKAQC